MGVSISLKVSRWVTSERWTEVYQEALYLARRMNLASWQKVTVEGYPVRCLTSIFEVERHGVHGWSAIGDFENGDFAESFFLPAELPAPQGDVKPNILLQYADQCSLLTEDQPRANAVDLWGNKTQGYSYHLSLLAIGCLLEDRLGADALVYGDITAGQCREAVRRSNEYLDQPIRVPGRCDPDRLIARVKCEPITELERIRIVEDRYLGKKDLAFGEKLRSNFPAEALSQFWAETFEGIRIKSNGFAKALKRYLSMGFNIVDLCRLVRFTDDEGNDLHEAFVRMIMDAKLHLPEKDCSDPLALDPDDPNPYGVDALMVWCFAGSAMNPKVNRYIPLEELRRQLKEGLGQEYAVDQWMDQYLQQEQSEPGDDSDHQPDGPENDKRTIKDRIRKALRQVDDTWGQYDIHSALQLQFYQPGHRMMPDLEFQLIEILQFAEHIVDAPEYQAMRTKPIHEKIAYLIAQGQDKLTLRDRDWDSIIVETREDPERFQRYFSLFCIKCKTEELRRMLMALTINDDLYDEIKHRAVESHRTAAQETSEEGGTP